MRVTQQRVTTIESEELLGSLTLNTLRRVGEATNTTFVYGFVPNTSLESTVKSQAIKGILNRSMRTKHSMNLEGQLPNDKTYEQLVELEAEELINHHPSKIWDME